MTKKIRVSFIGATSITAQFALRLLTRHGGTVFAKLVSETHAGKKTGDVFPELAGTVDVPLVKAEPSEVVSSSDVIFLFKQHGKSIDRTAELFRLASAGGRGVRIIDMSADFRLQDASQYDRYYGVSHPAPELLKKAVYGLPELYSAKIRKAQFVANPGCYPTSVILALAPALKLKLARPEGIVIESYSGVSGAGRVPGERNIAVNVMENITPYKVNTHQHIPEIAQELSSAAGRPAGFSFVPHIAPVLYGIFTTAYFDLQGKADPATLAALYRKFYSGCPFVRVLSPGVLPELKNVIGTNYCDLSFFSAGKGKIGVMSVIDNIIKGASGQAVQNMNLMFGFEEKTGLKI